MEISSLLEAIQQQAIINRYLAKNGIKDLVGDFGEILVHEALGGVRQSPTNKGFDLLNDVYKRVEVKTRKYEIKQDGTFRKENRAVGFDGKQDSFDWLAHVVLDVDFTVLHGCLVRYEDVWPEILKTTMKVGYSKSSKLKSSIDITEELKTAQNNLYSTKF